MEPITIMFVHPLGMTEQGSRTVSAVGVLRTEADGLVLEFRREEDDGISETREGEIQTVHIPWVEIQSVEYERGWIVGGKLWVRTRSLRALAGVPFAEGNAFSITLTRAERPDARALAANVELAVAEQRLRDLGPLAPARSIEAPGLSRALPPG